MDARDKRGRTALMRAIAGDSTLDTIKALIAAGANLNARNRQGRTTLMLAVSRPDLEAALFLVKNSADVNAVAYRQTALMMAAQRYFGLDLVKCLVEHGADVAIRNAKGLTAADLACRGEIKEYLTSVENQPL